MREPPANLSDQTVRECLHARWGLSVVELAFLPLGKDSSAWVYRVRAADGATYFLKARLSLANEGGLAVPRYLYDHGVTQVIAPLSTTTGALWAKAAGYALILYPFVTGATGKQRGMTPQQWIDYGVLLRRVHDTVVAPDVVRVMRRESFTPEWTAMVRRLDAHIGARTFDDREESALALFWQVRREEIRTLLDRAEELGQRLSETAQSLILCHADIHTGNVLLDADGQVRFVDWDETVLAPRERDLMFVVGGISTELVGPGDETLFFQGYGATEVDRLALAYYRYAWAIGDIGSFGEQVFLRPDLGPETKRAGVSLFMGLFRPGEIVALASASETTPDATLDPQPRTRQP